MSDCYEALTTGYEALVKIGSKLIKLCKNIAFIGDLFI